MTFYTKLNTRFLSFLTKDKFSEPILSLTSLLKWYLDLTGDHKTNKILLLKQKNKCFFWKKSYKPYKSYTKANKDCARAKTREKLDRSRWCKIQKKWARIFIYNPRSAEKFNLMQFHEGIIQIWHPPWCQLFQSQIFSQIEKQNSKKRWNDFLIVVNTFSVVERWYLKFCIMLRLQIKK